MLNRSALSKDEELGQEMPIHVLRVLVHDKEEPIREETQTSSCEKLQKKP